MYLNFRTGLNSKPVLVPADSDLNKLIKNPNSDYYISLYKYSEKHKQILEEKHSLAGIRDTITDRLYFDFDSKEDLERARQDAITTAQRLVEKGFPEGSIGVYFTGSKGFNIEVPLTSTITPGQFRAAVFNVAGDLQTFDKVVNDPNRIVRIPGTKHQDSGLFKIPLTPDELCDLSIDEIRQKASRRRIIETNPTKADLPAELLVKEEVSIEKIAKELTFDISTIDMKNRPYGMDEAKYLLSRGFFKTGQRNHAMLCLASNYKYLKYEKIHTEMLLKATAIEQAERTGEEEFPEEEAQLILDQVYSDNWRGGIFTTKDPLNWLAQYAAQIGLDVTKSDEIIPMQIVDVEAEFTNFVQNLEQNTVLTGIPFIDKKMPLTIGTNAAIVGAPGSGKTTLALNILKNCSTRNMTTVFFSLDMHRKRMFEKIMYDVSGLTRDQLYDAFRNGKGKELVAKMKELYGSVWFYDRSGTRPADMANYIKMVEAHTGTKVKLVMIDYLERVSSEKSSDTEASKDIAQKIQDLVMDLDIACITLVQPNKAAYSAGPDSPIETMGAIKGSSYLQQSYRNIISLWRPGYNPNLTQYDKFVEFAILKNDLGELGKTVMGFDGAKGHIRVLEDFEYGEYEALMQLKSAKKDEEKGNGGWDF